MTRVRTALEEPDLPDERDRVAWNLPRRPREATGRAASTSSTIVRPVGDESSSHDPAVERDLDWQGFLLRYFPARRRHHLPAVAAYGAYRSSRAVHASAEQAARPEVARPVSPAAIESWEDEGGAPLPQKTTRGPSPRRERSGQPVVTRQS